MKTAITLMEKSLLPDAAIRMGMRHINGSFLKQERFNPIELLQDKKRGFVKALKQSPIAIHTDKANQQHYELPVEFFDLVLGKWKKYSSCFWTEQTKSLTEAEETMLGLTCQRAQIQDGQSILDLGCGWGSLSLWIAIHYPNCKILSVSNSKTQKQYIDQQCQELGITNVTVKTFDVNQFNPEQQFDRIVSIEMFEHVRNYDHLFKRIESWLKPSGKLFVHIFCHKNLAYPFETNGDINWMGQYFFTGGIMPSEDLLLRFQNGLKIQDQWSVSGTHYQKTAHEWLKNQDKNKNAVMKIISHVYGDKMASIWYQRWRVFFIACEELFGYDHGNEWFVTHYLFEKSK